MGAEIHCECTSMEYLWANEAPEPFYKQKELMRRSTHIADSKCILKRGNCKSNKPTTYWEPLEFDLGKNFVSAIVMVKANFLYWKANMGPVLNLNCCLQITERGLPIVCCQRNTLPVEWCKFVLTIMKTDCQLDCNGGHPSLLTKQQWHIKHFLTC